MVSAGIDLCIKTETWLGDANDDARSILSDAGYVFEDVPRPSLAAGWLAIVHRQFIRHKRIRSAELLYHHLNMHNGN